HGRRRVRDDRRGAASPVSAVSRNCAGGGTEGNVRPAVRALQRSLFRVRTARRIGKRRARPTRAANMIRSTTAVACLAATLALVPVAAHGQATPVPFTVNVRVIDSAAAPIAGADVAVVRGIDNVVASGSSNVDGRTMLVVKDGSGDFEIVVRKIGYLRGDQFF